MKPLLEGPVKTILRIVRSLVVLLGSILATSTQAAGINSLVAGNTDFAFEFFSHYRESPGNLFFSPYSVSMCLSLARAGARGETKTQMDRVLRVGRDKDSLNPYWGALQKELKGAAKENGIKLGIANALWAQKAASFRPDFMEIAKGDFQASVQEADFGSSANYIAKEINRWISDNTANKIQSIVSPEAIDAYTTLILVNAIYFKGAWTARFDKNATTLQPFHLSDASQIQATLMHQVSHVNFVENNEFQAVELPYGKNGFSMVVLLPRHVSTLRGLEAKLTSAFLNHLLSRMRETDVKIFLPKFKMEARIDCRDTLEKMGMSDAFRQKQADFSGINGLSRDLYISSVLHKAWVEVTEEGTEAAAATVALAVSSSGINDNVPPIPVFRADHPFIFLIRDTRSGSLLFIGRLADPR